MPKKIYSNFLGGLSLYDRNAPDNTYNEGREIDPHRGLSYLQPGWLTSIVTYTDSDPQIIREPIVDILVDYTTDDAYFIGDTGDVYHMTSLVSETWDSNFDGASHYYYNIPDASKGYKLAIYPISGTNYLLYAYSTGSGATDGDVGIYDLSSTFNPDYLSTDVGTGAEGLVGGVPIDMLEWKTYMFISHGRYVGRFDGPNDTWDATKLDLGQNWEITKLFPTPNYIGICAWIKHTGSSSERTESRVFFWDGVSPTFNYWIPIADNKIETAYNKDGQILLLTNGRDVAVVLSEMTEGGSRKIRKLKTPIAGTVTNFNDMQMNAIDNWANRAIFGSRYLIWSYGQEEKGQPNAITIPWGYSGDSNAVVRSVKSVNNTKIFIGYEDVTNNKDYLLKANTGNSTRATYRGNYFDAGQKIRINYIKFYYKTLVSGDSVTPTLELDYGTSKDLRDPAGNLTITYTNDGSKNPTSKKFNVKEDCHAFRPVISWTAGGVAFSKIVVDFDFISDI